MHITRRIALRNILIVAASTALLPSCLGEDTPSSVALRKISINGDQEKNLAALTETIIPTTDTPGAREISAHLFVLKMVDDCYTTPEQQTFLEGMEAFTAECEKRYKTSFSELDAAKKKQLLVSLEQKEESGSPQVSFYRSVRSLTILGYTTSEYYLTKVRGYHIIPGKYQGAVPVKKSTVTNA